MLLNGDPTPPARRRFGRWDSLSDDGLALSARIARSEEGSTSPFPAHREGRSEKPSSSYLLADMPARQAVKTPRVGVLRMALSPRPQLAGGGAGCPCRFAFLQQWRTAGPQRAHNEDVSDSPSPPGRREADGAAAVAVPACKRGCG